MASAQMTAAVRTLGDGVRTARARRRWRVLWLQVGVIAVLLAAWQIVVSTGRFSERVLPSPLSVAAALGESLGSAAFWSGLGSTMAGALGGLGLSILIGVPLGLAVGATPTARRSTKLLFDVGRSFPVIAILPVMVLLLGSNTWMEIVVTFVAVVWPVLVQSIDGARRIDPVIDDTVRSYRIPRGLRYLRVVLPNALPFIATGIRIAASAAIVIALAVEILSLTPGIGGLLARTRADGATSYGFAYVAVAGVIGILLNNLLWLLEERLLAWNRRGTREAG